LVRCLKTEVNHNPDRTGRDSRRLRNPLAGKFNFRLDASICFRTHFLLDFSVTLQQILLPMRIKIVRLRRAVRAKPQIPCRVAPFCIWVRVQPCLMGFRAASGERAPSDAEPLSSHFASRRWFLPQKKTSIRCLGLEGQPRRSCRIGPIGASSSIDARNCR
jgi:hypothetical protein